VGVVAELAVKRSSEERKADRSPAVNRSSWLQVCVELLGDRIAMHTADGRRPGR